MQGAWQAAKWEASSIAAAADKKGEIAVFLAKKRQKKTSHKRATKYPLETFATKSVYLGQMSGTFKYSFFLFDFNAKNTKC